MSPSKTTKLLLLGFLLTWAGTFALVTYSQSNWERQAVNINCGVMLATHRGCPHWLETDDIETDTSFISRPQRDLPGKLHEFRVRVYYGNLCLALAIAALPCLLLFGGLGLRSIFKQGWRPTPDLTRWGRQSALLVILLLATSRLLLGQAWLVQSTGRWTYPYPYEDATPEEILFTIALGLLLLFALTGIQLAWFALASKFAARRARRAALLNHDWPHETPPTWDEAKPPAQEPLAQPQKSEPQA